MGGHDEGHVLLVALLAPRRGGGPGAVGGQPALLDPCVHVRLVVYAELYHVLVSLGGCGDLPEADVADGAVPRGGDHGDIVPALGLEGVDYASGSIGDEAEVEAEGGNLDVPDGAHGARPVAIDHGPRPEGLERELPEEGATAAGAASCAALEQVLLVSFIE